MDYTWSFEMSGRRSHNRTVALVAAVPPRGRFHWVGPSCIYVGEVTIDLVVVC